MRLLTHNQLSCIIKGCNGHYPLELVPRRVEAEESDYNPQFVLNVVSKIDYGVLLAAAARLGIDSLPAALPAQLNADEHADLLQNLHTVILDTHVQEGELKCGKCGRIYPIQQGIPNMRLNELEVPGAKQ